MTVTTIRGLDFNAGAPIQVEIKNPEGRTLVLAGVSEIALSQTPNGCIRAVMISADAESSLKACEDAHSKCHKMVTGHGQQVNPQDAGTTQPWHGLSPTSRYSVSVEEGVAAQQQQNTAVDIGPVDMSFEDSQFETLPDPSKVVSAANTSGENLEHVVAEGFMFDPSKALQVREPLVEPTPEKCEFQRIADAITDQPLAALHH